MFLAGRFSTLLYYLFGVPFSKASAYLLILYFMLFVHSVLAYPTDGTKAVNHQHPFTICLSLWNMVELFVMFPVFSMLGLLHARYGMALVAY